MKRKRDVSVVTGIEEEPRGCHVHVQRRIEPQCLEANPLRL